MATKKRWKRRAHRAEAALVTLANSLGAERELRARVDRAAEENARLRALVAKSGQATNEVEQLRADVARLSDENRRLWHDMNLLASEAAPRDDQ